MAGDDPGFPSLSRHPNPQAARGPDFAVLHEEAPAPAGRDDTTSTPAPLGVITLLDRIGGALFRLPLWGLGLLLTVVAVAKNGIWYNPALDAFLEISRQFPEPPNLGPGAYLLSSPLGPAIAWLLHLDGALAFVVLHLAVLLASAGGLVLLVRRRFGVLAAQVTMVALFCSPLSNLLLTWLGQPDPFTFAGASGLVVLQSPVGLFVAALMLGVNHFEQGVFMVLAAFVLRLKDDGRRALFRIGAIGVGICAGKLALQAYHHRYGITSGGDRLAYATTASGFRRFFDLFAMNFPTWLFSVFNAMWLFLAAVYLRHRRELLVALGLLVLFVIPAVLALDETRVYALITWPVVLWVVLWICCNEDEMLVRRLATVTLLLGVLLPRVIVWEGRTYTSSLRLLVRWLVS